MERQLAYIETITSLSPIPGADKIEKATILGWELVCKKGEFQVGDKAVYCEIDSVLPPLKPFLFLEPKKFRIRTVKLRNQISQGIAFPLSVVNEVDPSVDISKLQVGDDLTEILKITKYVSASEQEEDNFDETRVKLTYWEKKLRYWKWKLFGYKPVKAPGGFPTQLVPKTDEIRVQKMQSLLNIRQGDLCYIDEKVEGTSSSFIYTIDQGNWFSNLLGVKQGTFLICSRNRVIFNSSKQNRYPTHRIAAASQRYDLQNKLQKLGKNIAIQAECVGRNPAGGDNIQGNIYKLDNYDLYVFRVWDVDQQKNYSYPEAVKVCDQLGLKMAPLVASLHVLSNSIPDYVEMSKGYSAINPNVKREGIVVKALDGSFSFKSINPEYLLHSEL